MAHRIWRGARGGGREQDGPWMQTRSGGAHMRTWIEAAAAAAGALLAVGVGTPVLAALSLPVVFPVVVAAGALYAWRIDER
jgi:hypothetical protein